MCLRGLSDLADSYLNAHDSPSIQVYVVFVPALGAQSTDVAATTRFLQNDNVHYYWDADGSIMLRFAKAVGVDTPVWDFWSIYQPGTVWTGENPPAPNFWQHQMGSLPAASRLDIPTFVAQIRRLKGG